jgi:hypothetical protein
LVPPCPGSAHLQEYEW